MLKFGNLNADSRKIVVLLPLEIFPHNNLIITQMLKEFKLSNFDFSGRFVRFNGERQTKFGLMWIISHIDPFSCYGIYDSYPYADYVSWLKSHLC